MPQTPTTRDQAGPSPTRAQLPPDQASTAPSPAQFARQPAVPALVRRFIFQRDQRCQYLDPRNHKICGSRRFLTIDHITPRWDNGNNRPENLRVLCSQHNAYRYRVGAVELAVLFLFKRWQK